ncbi:TolB-like translocation protein [Goekera deserti]|uniref:TolB-like translocation protein n=1 Tax=Goekera deserti TaxID=2497753 RepID=UPI001391621A|nr:TolB-like translocation protein [Goekera deserti]
MVAVVVVLVLLLAGTGGYLAWSRSAQVRAAASAADAEAGRTRLAVDDVLAVPHLVVRNTEPGPSYGKIALVPVSDPAGPRAIVDLACARVAASPRAGLCLQEVPGLVTTYRSILLDASMRVVSTTELGGIPSRARMSAAGSWAASTVFVTGHAYTDAQFSTRTVLTDVPTGRELPDLEQWVTTRDGVPVTAVDRNYWGVSFIGDGPGFYATLGTGGRRLLVRGDASTRTMQVVADDGACPSVSPDAAHVVYKQQDAQSGSDRFVAWSADSGRLTALPEGRVVDDQVAWLDADTVAYAVGRGVAATVDSDVWAAPIDGRPATRLVPDASSPSVVVPARD